MTFPSPRVLLVDDNADDRFLFCRALQKSGFGGSLVEIEDGEKAIEHLKSKPRPDFIILDLNMPRISGFEVLEWVKGQPFLKNVLIFVLTSSPIPADIEKAKGLGAAEYIVKEGYNETSRALSVLNSRYFFDPARPFTARQTG